MLRHFGAKVDVEATEGGGRVITLDRPARAARRRSRRARRSLLGGLPGRGGAARRRAPTSTVEGVGINPLRTGLFETLLEMGAAIELAQRAR